VTDSPAPIDCLVLSGGGAKGAYGAGAAKALLDYYAFKRDSRRLCFVGTSVGALNAVVLASKGGDAAIDLWRSLSRRGVLGPSFVGVWLRTLRRSVWHSLARRAGWTRVFSIYDAGRLRELIRKSLSGVAFERLEEHAHIIVTASSLDQAERRAFYVSRLIDTFKRKDELLPLDRQRLSHFTRIGSFDELLESLLASAAYPVALPPVKLGTEWFVDGGVGNHTPTGEAAMFLRYAEECAVGTAGPTYCIRQDPARVSSERRHLEGPLRLAMNSFDVYHHIHTGRLIQDWHNINDSMRRLGERMTAFETWLNTCPLDGTLAQEILAKVRTVVRLGGATARKELQLVEIGPSQSVGDTWNFAAPLIERRIRAGHEDALQKLRDRGDLTPAEFQLLLKQLPSSGSAQRTAGGSPMSGPGDEKGDRPPAPPSLPPQPC
jgi:predicted acylesterase/phospholipase RssA